MTGLAPRDLRGRRVAVSAADDGVLRAWDLADAAPLPHRLLLQEGCPGGLATAVVGANPTATPPATVPERAVVVAGDHRGSLHLWDPADGETVSSAPQPRRPPLYAVGCAVVHGLPVAVTADRDAVRMWSLRSLRPREVHAFVPPSPAMTISCIELRGRPTAVFGCANGSLHLLDLMTRGLIASSAPRRPIGANSPRTSANTGHVTALHTFASGGAATAVTGAADGSVHLWDLASPPGGPSGGHTDAIAAVTCVRHRGGLVVVTAGNDTTLRLWDMDTGAPAAPQVTDAVGTFTGVTSAAADDRTLVLTHAVNRPAEAWDLASGTPMDRHRPRWATAAAVGHHEGRPALPTSPSIPSPCPTRPGSAPWNSPPTAASCCARTGTSTPSAPTWPSPAPGDRHHLVAAGGKDVIAQARARCDCGAADAARSGGSAAFRSSLSGRGTVTDRSGSGASPPGDRGRLVSHMIGVDSPPWRKHDTR
ncbi:hypothetical protein ACFU6I_23155 [Streptomyces sp. NPDC057486]|uniref:WD40 repeat domain-containing protein n=1 Tax=Streptomyces sp. NPDC057486 TaxID=3346145 RepID=UPI0036A1BBFF